MKAELVFIAVAGLALRPCMVPGHTCLLCLNPPSFTRFLVSAGCDPPSSLELCSLVLSDQNLHPPAVSTVASCLLLILQGSQEVLALQGLAVILSILSIPHANLRKAKSKSPASPSTLDLTIQEDGAGLAYSPPALCCLTQFLA